MQKIIIKQSDMNLTFGAVELHQNKSEKLEQFDLKIKIINHRDTWCRQSNQIIKSFHGRELNIKTWIDIKECSGESNGGIEHEGTNVGKFKKSNWQSCMATVESLGNATVVFISMYSFVILKNIRK